MARPSKRKTSSATIPTAETPRADIAAARTGTPRTGTPGADKTRDVTSVVARGTSARHSIISPVVDFLSVGGLSLVLMIPLMLSGRSDLVIIGAGAQAWMATLINMPHFMASYRLVYGSRAMMREHKWAAYYIPLILLTYIAIAISVSSLSQVMGIIFITISSVYLAWHYTGQVWGMMASFAYLDGHSFDPIERKLIRASLRILLVWHLAWFLYTQLRDPSNVIAIYYGASALTVVGFVLGAVGLVRMKRRTGRMPPRLAIVAWLAIFTWYALMARDAKALFWVQIAHALQYLAFPVRMEINQAAASPKATTPIIAMRLVLYGVGLLVVSLIVSRFVPQAMMGAIGRIFGEEPARAAPILILSFINIHHYFTDGVLWKISNPAVRKQLFAHVKPA